MNYDIDMANRSISFHGNYFYLNWVVRAINNLSLLVFRREGMNLAHACVLF